MKRRDRPSCYWGIGVVPRARIGVTRLWGEANRTNGYLAESLTLLGSWGVAQPDSSPVRARLAGIEGLRGLAASSIVVYHVWLYGSSTRAPVDFGALDKVFVNLRAGVTLFFVLSGFLLFLPYAAAALRNLPAPSVRKYLRNRALRILPAYWAILLVVALVLQPALLRAPVQLGANLLFLQNYVPNYVGYVSGLGIVPAWSLAIEVVFYLALPALGLAAIRLAGRTGSVAAALAPVVFMTCLGIAAKLADVLVAGDAKRVWELTFPTHADWFGAGMAVAVARVLWEDGRLQLPTWWRPAATLGAIALTLAGAGLYEVGLLSGLENQTPIAWAFALLLALVSLPARRSWLVRLLEMRAMIAVGLASYSLFLWHDPIVRALRDAGLTLQGRSGFLVNLLVVSAVAGAASALTYRFVERPALARKHSWQGAAQQTSPPEQAPPPRPSAPEEPELQTVAAPGTRAG